MATFKIEEHHVREGGAAVCVFDDAGDFIATVVWRDGSIAVISKYIDGVILDERTPPLALITLKPRVHILHHGKPLCRFSDLMPESWPEGHRWIGMDEASVATCERCKSELGKQPA